MLLDKAELKQKICFGFNLARKDILSTEKDAKQSMCVQSLYLVSVPISTNGYHRWLLATKGDYWLPKVTIG